MKGHNWTTICRKCGKNHGPYPGIGRKLSAEHIKIIIKTNTGKVFTDEHKNKLKLFKPGKDNPMYGVTGSLHPRYGIKHSLETRKKISIAHMGKKMWSEEDKRKMSEKMKGNKNFQYGKKPSWKTSHGKGGFRKDLGLYVRSTWEANMARILNLLNIEWQYEPRSKRFFFDKEQQTYLPDFYLPKYNLYIELSGHVDEEKSEKLYLLKKHYPDIELVHIVWDIWKIHIMPYSEIIQGWEK